MTLSDDNLYINSWWKIWFPTNQPYGSSENRKGLYSNFMVKKFKITYSFHVADETMKPFLLEQNPIHF